MIRLKTNFFILLIFAITIGLIGPVFAQPNVDVARIQPYLLEISNTTPDKIVSVIIQRTSGSSDLENTIGRLGGSITQELAIIDAFSAVIPASAALKIASEPGVRWVSLDAPMVMSSCRDCVDGSNLESTYPLTVNADQVWVESTLWQGVSVAVLDSGMNYPVDFYSITGQNRILTSVSFQNGLNQSTFDTYGHGTHIAGIVAGNGRSSSGEYIGIAPQVNLINVKVCDDMENGLCTAQSIVDGFQ